MAPVKNGIAPAFASHHNFLRIRSTPSGTDLNNVEAQIPSSAFNQVELMVDPARSTSDFWFMISNTENACCNMYIMKNYHNSSDGKMYATLVDKSLKPLLEQDGRFCAPGAGCIDNPNGEAPSVANVVFDVPAACEGRGGCGNLSKGYAQDQMNDPALVRGQTPRGMFAFDHRKVQLCDVWYNVLDSKVTIANRGDGINLTKEVTKIKGLWLRHSISDPQVQARHEKHGFKKTGKRDSLVHMYYISDDRITLAMAKELAPEYFP